MQDKGAEKTKNTELKKERLTKALRENLRKRKEQMRQRKEKKTLNKAEHP